MWRHVALTVGLVGAAALVLGHLADSATQWAPPAPESARPYTAVLDRYLATRYHGSSGVFASGSRWYCATKFLGATSHGSAVTAYAWALCEETKRTGNLIRIG